MQYLSLGIWTILLIALVVWGQSFKTKQYDIIGKRSLFLGISGLALAIALGSLLVAGINWGLDFTGGTIIEAGAHQMVSADQVRGAVAEFDGLGDTTVQVGASMIDDLTAEGEEPKQYQKVIVRVTMEGGERLESDQAKALFDHLQTKLGSMKELRIASIGPTISGELARNAVLAVVLALGLQLIYIFFRFGNQIRYGIAADIALVHDVIIMVGFYSLAGREVDSPFVAALLTIVGYSVMDSVVIFDRIRENVNLRRGVSYEQVVNESVNQTMTRSINTTLTTVVTLLAIYYFGGSTLQNFAFALLVGIASGAYSSICVAAPSLVVLEQYQGSAPSSPSADEDLKPAPKVELEDEDADEADDTEKKVKAKAGSGGKRKRKRGSRS